MNTLTKKISQMDLSDGISTASSQSGSSKPGFTRVSRTDSANIGAFGSSRTNGTTQAASRAAPAPPKLKNAGSNQSLRALAAAKTTSTSTSSSTRAPQPLTANRTNQQQQTSMRAPVLTSKGSQSSLRSAPYGSATERPQQQRSGTNGTTASTSTQSSIQSKPSAPKNAVEAAVTLDLGKYDGGFDIENDRRGSAVYGEAASLLALDSSTSA